MSEGGPVTDPKLGASRAAGGSEPTDAGGEKDDVLGPLDYIEV